MRQLALLALFSCLLGACAVGNTHRYDLGDATLDFESDKALAITVVDARPAVLSGDKTPDFAGLMRGGFGNPFDIVTDSGQPLADDMGRSIVASLQANGIKALAVNTPPTSQLSAARQKLLGTNADRFVLLLMKAWNSDSYFTNGLTYDLTLSVLQQDGSVAAKKALIGHDNLGTKFTPADARVSTEKAFRQKLEALFSDSAVISALQ